MKTLGNTVGTVQDIGLDQECTMTFPFIYFPLQKFLTVPCMLVNSELHDVRNKRVPHQEVPRTYWYMLYALSFNLYSTSGLHQPKEKLPLCADGSLHRLYSTTVAPMYSSSSKLVQCQLFLDPHQLYRHNIQRPLIYISSCGTFFKSQMCWGHCV